MVMGTFSDEPHFDRQLQVAIQKDRRDKWYMIESVSGVMTRLSERFDLQLKVTERLRALFGREFDLEWPDGRLQVTFLRGDVVYPSAKEASGLLHLVAILAALYNDELAAVLIDEPGISLHPQYQSFVRSEMERVAGDPTAGKKLVVCATHAPAMTRLRQPTDLCNVVFFRDVDTLPVQVAPADETLRNQKLGTFIQSLGASHREALFAARPLLVEGPSDEVVVDALDSALDVNLHASGGHLVQAVGKGTMPTIIKLLHLIGKEPAVLADLDGFTDGLDLVNAFNDVESGRAAAGVASDIRDSAKTALEALEAAVVSNWTDIESLATSHSYWKDSTDPGTVAKMKRRAVAAVVLADNPERINQLENGRLWVQLHRQLSTALDILEKAGLFILRHGEIEDHYREPADRDDKIGSAAIEANAIRADPHSAEIRHSVALRALRHVSPSLPVDESGAVRVAFASVVAPAVSDLRGGRKTTTGALSVTASRYANSAASLFEVERADTDDEPTLKVGLATSILDVIGFPVYVRADEDAVTVADRYIQPKPHPTQGTE